MTARKERGGGLRPWLPMTSGLASLGVIGAMVAAALLAPSSRPPAPGPEVPELPAPHAALEGLHLCHESAAALDACWRATTPRPARPQRLAAPHDHEQYAVRPQRRIEIVRMRPGSEELTAIERMAMLRLRTAKTHPPTPRAKEPCPEPVVVWERGTPGGAPAGGVPRARTRG